MGKSLLFRVVDDNGGLVFAFEHEARRVAQINHAIDKATTWSQFRSLISSGEYSAILDALEDAGESQPRGSDEFSGEQIPGFCDGDYPTWLQQEMEHVVPLQILEKYGTLKTTVINGLYWHLPPERESEIVEALRVQGFTVEKAANLGFS